MRAKITNIAFVGLVISAGAAVIGTIANSMDVLFWGIIIMAIFALIITICCDPINVN